MDRGLGRACRTLASTQVNIRRQSVIHVRRMSTQIRRWPRCNADVMRVMVEGTAKEGLNKSAGTGRYDMQKGGFSHPGRTRQGQAGRGRGETTEAY